MRSLKALKEEEGAKGRVKSIIRKSNPKRKVEKRHQKVKVDLINHGQVRQKVISWTRGSLPTVVVVLATSKFLWYTTS